MFASHGRHYNKRPPGRRFSPKGGRRGSPLRGRRGSPQKGAGVVKEEAYPAARGEVQGFWFTLPWATRKGQLRRLRRPWKAHTSEAMFDVLPKATREVFGERLPGPTSLALGQACGAALGQANKRKAAQARRAAPLRLRLPKTAGGRARNLLSHRTLCEPSLSGGTLRLGGSATPM